MVSWFMPSEQFPQPGRFMICRVGGADSNAQFHFRSLIDLVPHRQLTFDKCGSFAHPAQTIVSLETVARENRRINALSVVPDAQSEFIVIADFNFYLLRLGVMEDIAAGREPSGPSKTCACTG
jgi:hypothetical protein